MRSYIKLNRFFSSSTQCCQSAHPHWQTKLVITIALLSLSACAPNSKPDMNRFSPQARALMRTQQARQQAAQSAAQQQAAQSAKNKTGPNITTTSGATGTQPITCRLAKFVPGQFNQLPNNAGKVAGAAIQNEQICQSAKVAVNNGLIEFPSNTLQVPEGGQALVPSSFTAGDTATKTNSTFTFQSPTLTTGELILTYILPGVDPSKLDQNQAGLMNVTVQAKSITQTNGRLTLQPGSDYQLESLSVNVSGQGTELFTAIHITNPSLFANVSANYALQVQVPNNLISDTQSANNDQTGKAIPTSESEAKLILSSSGGSNSSGGTTNVANATKAAK